MRRCALNGSGSTQNAGSFIENGSAFCFVWRVCASWNEASFLACALLGRTGREPWLKAYFTAIASISMLAFFGRAATAKAERAGYGAVKNSAYTSFTAAKSLMSARRTVTFTTLDIESPASARMFLMFVSD